MPVWAGFSPAPPLHRSADLFDKILYFFVLLLQFFLAPFFPSVLKQKTGVDIGFVFAGSQGCNEKRKLLQQVSSQAVPVNDVGEVGSRCSRPLPPP